MKQAYKKALIGLLIALGIVVWAMYSGVSYSLSLAMLKEKIAIFLTYKNHHYVLVVLAYIALYIIITAFSIPQAAILSLAGGALFGTLPATLYVIVGATIGSACCFLLTRFFLRSFVEEKYVSQLAVFNNALAGQGYLYLIIVRLIPLFPFFVVNILASLSNVSLQVFMVTTAVGIIPGVIAYTFAGHRLSEVESLRDVLSKEFWFAMVILVALLLLPLVVKKIMQKK